MITLHADAWTRIQQQVDVVGLLDLSYVNPTTLATWLQQFTNREFSPRERLILQCSDTDYYPHMDALPNNLYNTLICLAHFNISSDHVILFTNECDLQPMVNQQCDIFNITPPLVVSSRIWADYPSDFANDINPLMGKSYLYSCLNGVPRTHRRTLMAMLVDRGLDKQGIVTWRPDYTPESDTLHEHESAEWVEPILRTTRPWSRINEELSLCSQSKKLHVKLHQELSQQQSHHLVDTVDISKGTRTAWSADFLQHSLVYIITETVGEYPRPWFSEKTWKAMYSMMPFMMVGAKHSLQTLQDLGFETFGDIWDEGYDNLPHVTARISAMVDNLVWLSSQDLDQIFAKCLPKLKHNRLRLQSLRLEELEKIEVLLR